MVQQPGQARSRRAMIGVRSAPGTGFAIGVPQHRVVISLLFSPGGAPMPAAAVSPVETGYAHALKHGTLLYEQCGTTQVMQVADDLPNGKRLKVHLKSLACPGRGQALRVQTRIQHDEDHTPGVTSPTVFGCHVGIDSNVLGHEPGLSKAYR